MSWAWLVAFLGLLVLVGLGLYYWGKLSQSKAQQTSDSRSSRPYNPSVFVDMDDKPPMEIDFDAGIKANKRAQPQNPSKDDAT